MRMSYRVAPIAPLALSLGRVYTRPKDFDPDKHLKGSFGVMSGDGDYEVVIEFDAWATDLLQGRQ